MHHSTGYRRRVKNGDGIAEQREVVRRGHARWTGTDNGNLFRPDGTGRFGKYVNGIAGFRSMALGDETLQSSVGKSRAKLAASTGCLARMPTDTATDGSEGIGDPSVAVRFLVPPLGDQRHVPSGLGVDWTRLHARKVRFQPFKIDEFGAHAHLTG